MGRYVKKDTDKYQRPRLRNQRSHYLIILKARANDHGQQRPDTKRSTGEQIEDI